MRKWPQKLDGRNLAQFYGSFASHILHVRESLTTKYANKKRYLNRVAVSVSSAVFNGISRDNPRVVEQCLR